MANCTTNCDGLEYFNGKLIENRADASSPYSIYNTNGSLLTANFITAPLSSTGIAFDGTNFWTSNVFNQSLSEWNGTTGAFIKNLTLQAPPSGAPLYIEDLSVNYSQVIPPVGVPEPSALGMFGFGMLFIGVFARLRSRSVSAWDDIRS